MATKAETFRADAERNAQKPGARGERAPHPQGAASRVVKDSSYELEVSRAGKPSRRSTRKSPAHVKTDSSLRLKAVDERVSPKARATRPKG